MEKGFVMGEGDWAKGRRSPNPSSILNHFGVEKTSTKQGLILSFESVYGLNFIWSSYSTYMVIPYRKGTRKLACASHMMWL